MTFINEVIESIFIGFGVFILATSIRFKNEKRNELIINLTHSAIMITRVAAIAYLAIWFADLYIRYQSEEEYYSIVTRLTGPYWFGYWIYPICYGIVPQLLWLKRIRQIKAMRMIIAFLFLFALYIEKAVILITSFHRDYIPSSWTMLPRSFILYDWLVNLLIFVFILGFAHFLKLKLSDLKKS